jgi:predicted O-linked N-acetylglucosamine transferase (SPINDLY family)
MHNSLPPQQRASRDNQTISRNNLMGLFDFLKRNPAPTAEEHSAPLTDRQKATILINRGNASEEAGRMDDAMALYDEAIALAPELARAHMNRGNILLARDQPGAALSAYERATGLEPDYPAAHFNRGNALAALSRHDEALEAYRSAIMLQPDFVEAHIALGCSLEDLGQTEDALSSYLRALEFCPTYGEVHANLGRLLLALGRNDEGIASYERCIALMPDNDEVLAAVGTAQFQRGRLEEARKNLTRAIDLSPDRVDTLIHLGDVLIELGFADAAIECFNRALQISPDNAAARLSSGSAHFLKGEFAEAAANYRKATEISPTFAAAHGCLGSVLKDIGKIDEGIVSTRRALELEPNLHVVRSNLLLMGQSFDGMSKEQRFAEALAFGRTVAQGVRKFESWGNQHDPERPIRIGLVSADLCTHPVGFFIEGVLSALAHTAGNRLSVVAYMNNPKHDPIRARIKSLCSNWHDVHGLPDEELVTQIRNDRIDILIDLAGHTAKNRLPAFAWKPAPVQVTWLGYFATTGVEEIDYVIADPWTLPESEERFFTEKVWRLPRTRLCFTPPEPPVETRLLPAADEGVFTFGCFNSLNKMSDEVVAIWARVLNERPQSRLYLKARQLYRQGAQAETVARFKAHGIAGERLILEGPSQRANYFACYNRVDIALDPFPYTGGTTTAEALWMGVPVLTLRGESFLERQGYGLNGNAGLLDWVADDLGDYVARAVSWSNDLERLAALRSSLRERVLASPIFDSTQFAIDLEEALRSMWRIWCNSQATGAGSVPSASQG